MKRPRYLLVQCCHIPQFFFAVRQLRAKFPDAIIDALVVKDEQVRYYVGLFGVLNEVHYAPDIPQGEYDGIVFPLLNRGYRTIKLQAWSVKGPKLDLDFEGRIVGLSAWRLRKSYFRPLHAYTREFQEYLASFPHRPIGESVLFCKSCDRSLVRKLRPKVDEYLAPGSDICFVRSRSLRAALRRIRGRAFDSAVVFFSAEKGFAHLKVLPFLLRIRKILVVNENGDCFYASARSLAGFLWLRVRSGFRQPRLLPPRILVFQTAEIETTQQVVKRMSVQARFKRAEIFLVSDQASRERLRTLPEVKRVLSLPDHPTIRQRIVLWSRLRNLAPDLTVMTLAGKTGYSLQKLIFWLLPARRLAFTATLKCYRISLRTLLLPFPEQLSETAEELDASEGTILFVDGTRSAAAPEAIGMLGNPKIVRRRPIVVLCQAARKHVFRNSAGILQVVTYRRWNPFTKFVAALRCLALNADVVTGIFAGRRLSRLNQLLFFFLPVRHRLVFNQHLGCFYAGWGSLGRFLKTIVERTVVARTASRGHALFLDTTRSPKAVEFFGVLNDPKVIRRQPVEVICREDRRKLFEGLPDVRAIHTLQPRRPIRNLQTLIGCASFDVDVIAGVFSGSRPRRWLQFLLFLLPARHRLVINRYGGCFYADRDHLPLLVRNLLDATPPVETLRPILFIDKPGSHRAPQAARKLQSPAISLEKRPITVVCPRGREALYRGISGVGRIQAYGRGGFPLALLRVRRTVGLRPEIVATVFDGRRLNRLAQLFALAFPARHRLLFNQNVDCFYFSFRHFGHFWRALRERDETYARRHSYSLFIQTAEDEKAVRALRMLNDPLVARPRPIIVFCRQDKRPLFQRMEGVYRVFAYEPGSSYSNLRTLARFFAIDIEVVAAVFTGRPIYRLQKLLFFVLPARHRLAFNSHLDCFYLTSGNWSSLLRQDKRQPARVSPALRVFLKASLFFPRFLFLVIWVTGLKMKRAYTQVPEVK